jgi:hypothetical protein
MSILNVNQIQPVGSGQTVTISAANITASSSTITANTFSGALSSSGVSTFSDTVNVGAGKSIRLYGASSGYSQIVAAAGSASTTFTLPANGGSSGQYLQTNGSGALSWATVSASKWTIDTTGTSLTGSSVSVTGIPSTAVHVRVIVRDMSLDGNNETDLRLGTSSGLAASGYSASGGYWGGANNLATFTDKFGSNGLSALQYEINGVWNFWKMGGGNNWYGHGQFMLSSPNTIYYNMQGFVELGGALDRVGFLTRSGNFDAGTVFVSYMEP